MIEPTRILEPLTGAEDATRSLREYESPAELARSLQQAWDAVQKSLRLLLRADTTVPDYLRLAALSGTELPAPKLIETLRQRELISLELAGSVHELEQAARRAASGDVRAADADAAARAVERLRAEVHALADRPMREAAHHAVSAGQLEETAHAVPPAGRWRRPRAWLLGAILLAAAVLAGVFVLVATDPMDEAIVAFQAGQLRIAEQRLRAIVADDPDNVTALLYLGRVYRRQANHREAADALRRAADEAPDDPEVRRELGHLFLDLERPQAAAEQYRRALELEPEESLNWIGLIRALRAAGDPRAEEFLERAPASARATLARQRDTGNE